MDSAEYGTQVSRPGNRSRDEGAQELEIVSTIPKGCVNGNVFTDGSADRHPVAELRRAAWAVVWISEQGDTVAEITGAVLDSLPQTPQTGEYMAAPAAVQLTTVLARHVTDCLGVSRAMTKLKADCKPEGIHAGAARAALESGNVPLALVYA